MAEQTELSGGGKPINMATKAQVSAPTITVSRADSMSTGSGGSIDLEDIHQVYRAMEYLRDYDTENDPSTTEHTIVVLLAFSRKGNKIATDLLEECLARNIGIDESNITDVQWCLDTPAWEKNARHAAIVLYNRINPLSGSHLSKDQYRTAVKSVVRDKSQENLLVNTAKTKGDEPITEEAFVQTILSKLHGKGGISLDQIMQTDVEKVDYERANVYTKVVKYPGVTLMRIGDTAVEYAAKQGMTVLTRMIPTQQIYVLLIFFLYSMLSFDFILAAIPLFTLYFSMIAMIICTMQMFYNKKKLTDIKAVSDMLRSFNEAVDGDTAESSYVLKSLSPYLIFFIMLIINVISLSLVDIKWVPCPEIVFMSIFLCMSCFAALSDRYDYITILSMICSVTSTLPTIVHSFPRIPVIYHLVVLFCDTIFSVEIIPLLHLNFGLPSMVYLVVPILFTMMAIQKSWQGTYRVLIPHLVCFFWWQVGMMYYKHTTWTGLLRGSVGWAVFLILLPVLGVGVFIWGMIYLFTGKFFTWGTLLKVATTFALIGLPAGLTIWAKGGFKIRRSSTAIDEDSEATERPDQQSPYMTTKAKSMIFALVSVFSIIPMVYYFAPREYDVGGNYLSWDQYRKYCSVPQWEKTNMADAMMKCSHFSYTMVSWEGKITKVTLRDVENQALSFINILPWMFGDWLKCTYGEPYPECSTLKGEEEKELCELRTMQRHKCHLSTINHYTFEIWIDMPIENGDPQPVILYASHYFKEYLLKLHAGDVISFRAALKDNIGGWRPELKLFYVNCESCVKSECSSAQLSTTEMGIGARVQLALHDTWNFFFAPLVEFRPREKAENEANENN